MRYSPIIGVEQILFDKGYYTLQEYVPKLGDIVVDVGAFVGLYTALASEAVGSAGTIISIEPDPINFRWLVETCRLNGFKNVYLIKAALSDYDGLINLHREHSLFPSSTAKVVANSFSPLKVRCYRFDTLRTILRIKHVNLMKIDVEGHEVNVLKGCIQSFNEGVIERVVIEVHTPVNENLREILSFLRKFPDYKVEGFLKGVLFLSYKG